jgi:hypothetical protein
MPFLLHLPGVSGDTFVDHLFLSALKDGGFNAETRSYDWPARRSALTALIADDLHRRAAARVATILTARHRAHPDQPLYLTCESGGAGPAVWALELLPEDVRVEAAVLLAPALSPRYDLTRALRHVRREMLVFPSRGDLLVLGAGTTLLGTVDGRHEAAAGMLGFRAPPTADAAQYLKLHQIPYDPRWLFDYAHTGGHIDALNPLFASTYLAPLLAASSIPATFPAPPAYDPS